MGGAYWVLTASLNISSPLESPPDSIYIYTVSLENKKKIQILSSHGRGEVIGPHSVALGTFCPQLSSSQGVSHVGFPAPSCAY